MRLSKHLIDAKTRGEAGFVRLVSGGAYAYFVDLPPFAYTSDWAQKSFGKEGKQFSAALLPFDSSFRIKVTLVLTGSGVSP
jgi:hypothetical protein